MCLLCLVPENVYVSEVSQTAPYSLCSALLLTRAHRALGASYALYRAQGASGDAYSVGLIDAVFSERVIFFSPTRIKKRHFRFLSGTFTEGVGAVSNTGRLSEDVFTLVKACQEAL